MHWIVKSIWVYMCLRRVQDIHPFLWLWDPEAKLAECRWRWGRCAWSPCGPASGRRLLLRRGGKLRKPWNVQWLVKDCMKRTLKLKCEHNRIIICCSQHSELWSPVAEKYNHFVKCVNLIFLTHLQHSGGRTSATPTEYHPIHLKCSRDILRKTKMIRTRDAG